MRTPLFLFLSLHLVIAVVVGYVSATDHSGDDFDRYWEIASSAGRPYQDFEVEYPVGTLVLLKTVAAVTRDRTLFRLTLVAANLVADGIVVAVLAWGWGRCAATFYAAAALPILSLLFFRFDLWSIAAVAAALSLWRRDARISAAVALAAGTVIKLWPLPFGALLLKPEASVRRPARAIAVFGALIATAALFWWIEGGQSGFEQVVTFRGARGWNAESAVGSILALVGSPVRVESGAIRVGSTNGLIAVVMFAVAVPICAWLIWRGAVNGHVGAGSAAGVGTILLFSPLLSPQFLGWLLPPAAIAWAQRDRVPAGLVPAIALLTAVYRIDSVPATNLLVVIRNVGLIAIVWTGATAAHTRIRIPVAGSPVA